jgi:hypothetical protein
MACLSASRLGAALADRRLRPDVALLGYGLRQDWIAIHTVEDMLLAGHVLDSTDEVVVEVSLAMDEGREAVQAVLDAFLAGRSQDRGGLLQKVWWGLLITDLLISDEDTNTVLTRVAGLWADIGYPPEWESFINYLPQPDLLPKSPQAVLERAAQHSRAWAAARGSGQVRP